MRRSAVLAIMFLLSAGISFAQKHITVEHNYSGFSAVEAGNYFDISIIPSDEYTVRITTDVMIENYILAYAKDGTLYLSIDEKAMPSDVRKTFRSKNPVLAMPHVDIYTPEIKSVTLAGSSVIDCDSLVTSSGTFSLVLSRNAAVRKMAVKADMVRMELTNRAQAYMSVESKALNVQCLQNSKAELKVDVQNLTVNASSFATVELFGNAVRMALDAESNSRIWMERNDGE